MSASPGQPLDPGAARDLIATIDAALSAEDDEAAPVAARLIRARDRRAGRAAVEGVT